MNIKYYDAKSKNDHMSHIDITSDLLNDVILIHSNELGEETWIELDRKDSIEIANKILEFWNNNPKLNI